MPIVAQSRRLPRPRGVWDLPEAKYLPVPWGVPPSLRRARRSHIGLAGPFWGCPDGARGLKEPEKKCGTTPQMPPRARLGPGSC